MAAVSMSEYARIRNVSPAYISKIVGRGVLNAALVRKKGRKKPLINTAKADKILAENQDPGFTKASPVSHQSKEVKDDSFDEQKQSGDQSFIQARTWSERYKAAERKLRFEIQQGKWILKSTVRNQAFEAGRIFRDSILNIGPRVAPILAAMDDEAKINEVLKKELTDSLYEIIRQLTSIGMEG